ncbi:MAG: glycosyltransferase family 2 protein [Rhodocyclaceae bacterium]
MTASCVVQRLPVSVVIPCYRCAETLPRAVASVLAQTAQAAEIVLVDDASGDDTLACMQALQQAHPAGFVRLVSAVGNGGAGEARNLGWADATQAWIAFLDADDVWHPEKLARQFDWLQAHPQVVASVHRSVQVQEVALPAVLPAWEISLSALLFANMIPTRSVMLRRDLSQRFPRGWRYAEDYMLWLDIVASGGRVAMLDVPMAFSFRPEFSAGGLSARLWKMESGELACYNNLRRQGRIGWPLWCAASAWSLLRYFKRLLQTLRGRA